MQVNKIGAVLLKSLKWFFVFSLIFITLFGVALGVSMSWPVSVFGWALAWIPLIIWNVRKILSLCQQFGNFIYKLLFRGFVLFRKRKWAAIFCWMICFLYNSVATLIISIPLFILYIFICFREVELDWERHIKYMRERGLPISKYEALLYIYKEQRKFRKSLEDWIGKNHRDD